MSKRSSVDNKSKEMNISFPKISNRLEQLKNDKDS
jgi:DNA-binding Lrp family transcriptional regulator